MYLGSGKKDLKRGLAEKAVEVISSWQSEKVEMKRKESSDQSNISLSICSSREIDGENIRGPGEPVIR